MSLAELIALVPPPAHPEETGTPEGWINAGKELGISFPDDYKEFTDTYGTGYLAEFFHIFNPFSVHDSRSLKVVRRTADVYRDLRKYEGKECVPYFIYPQEGGLIPWGRTDNGDTMFWRSKEAPNEWPVVLNQSRSSNWQKFKFGMVEFLVRAVTNRLESKYCDWTEFFEAGPPFKY